MSKQVSIQLVLGETFSLLGVGQFDRKGFYTMDEDVAAKLLSEQDSLGRPFFKELTVDANSPMMKSLSQVSDVDAVLSTAKKTKSGKKGGITIVPKDEPKTDPAPAPVVEPAQVVDSTDQPAGDESDGAVVV